VAATPSARRSNGIGGSSTPGIGSRIPAGWKSGIAMNFCTWNMIQ